MIDQLKTSSPLIPAPTAAPAPAPATAPAQKAASSPSAAADQRVSGGAPVAVPSSAPPPSVAQIAAQRGQTRLKNLVSGTWNTMTGVVQNREGIPEGPVPAGHWLQLDKPIMLKNNQPGGGGAAQKITSVFISDITRQYGTDGQGNMTSELHGRIDLVTRRGLNGNSATFAQLTGISDLRAGEPRFNGKTFTDRGETLTQLQWFSGVPDVPAQLFVLDGDTAFAGAIGGFTTMPFHFTGKSFPIQEPDALDRQSVKIDAQGNAVTQDGRQLREIGHQAEGPGDEPGQRWFVDSDSKTIYGFQTGGFVGVPMMNKVIRFGDQAPPEALESTPS
jgi:hypothetical protein